MEKVEFERLLPRIVGSKATSRFEFFKREIIQKWGIDSSFIGEASLKKTALTKSFESMLYSLKQVG